MLFLVYINNIVLELNCTIRLFAEDTRLHVHIVVENPNASVTLLNSSLGNIHSWSKDWLVDFNPYLTDSMVLSRKILKPYHPPVIMNNVVIKEVDRHRHLGITFSSDLNWYNCIIETTNRTWQRLNIIQTFKFRFDTKSLERMYILFISSTSLE